MQMNALVLFMLHTVSQCFWTRSEMLRLRLGQCMLSAACHQVYVVSSESSIPYSALNPVKHTAHSLHQREGCVFETMHLIMSK